MSAISGLIEFLTGTKIQSAQANENNNRIKTAVNDNYSRITTLDGLVVKKDGSVASTGLQSYSTDLTPSDDKHIPPKKYIDDEITALGSTYAALAGSSSQAFEANDGATGKQVVNISQFSSSLSTNGHGYLPDGRLMQWGAITSLSNDIAITFDETFGAVYSVTFTASATNAGVNDTPVIKAGSITTSGFNILINASLYSAVYWTAIGEAA